MLHYHTFPFNLFLLMLAISPMNEQINTNRAYACTVAVNEWGIIKI